jgi:hypothetical protein
MFCCDFPRTIFLLAPSAEHFLAPAEKDSSDVCWRRFFPTSAEEDILQRLLAKICSDVCW